MRRLWITFAFLLLAGSAPRASHAEQPSLVGVWKLISFAFESIESAERRNVYGEKPAGYLVITPERFTAVITGDGRKPPQTDDERLSNFRSMTAYTGLYRIEGNQLTTTIDAAWNESWKGTDQVRFFRLQGDRLFIESAPAASVNYPELGKVRAILEWQRSK